MGTVITGISAGLEEQKILVSDLVTVRPGFDDNTIIVNNRHAATLAGMNNLYTYMYFIERLIDLDKI